MAEREKILEVRDLSISFKTTAGNVNAIRGVNLDLYRGGQLRSSENQVQESR